MTFKGAVGGKCLHCCIPGITTLQSPAAVALGAIRGNQRKCEMLSRSQAPHLSFSDFHF